MINSTLVRARSVVVDGSERIRTISVLIMFVFGSHVRQGAKRVCKRRRRGGRIVLEERKQAGQDEEIELTTREE